MYWYKHVYCSGIEKTAKRPSKLNWKIIKYLFNQHYLYNYTIYTTHQSYHVY